jgi:hypothetical protein
MDEVFFVWIEKRREALEIGLHLDEKEGERQAYPERHQGPRCFHKDSTVQSQVLDSKSSLSLGSTPCPAPLLAPLRRCASQTHIPSLESIPRREGIPPWPPPKPRNLSSFYSWVRLIAGLQLRKGVGCGCGE